MGQMSQKTIIAFTKTTDWGSRKASVNRKSFPLPFFFFFFFNYLPFLSMRFPQKHIVPRKCCADLELHSKRNTSNFSMSYLNTRKVSLFFYQMLLSCAAMLSLPLVVQATLHISHILLPHVIRRGYKCSKKTDLIWVLTVVGEIEIVFVFIMNIFTFHLHNFLRWKILPRKASVASGV